MIKEQQNKHWTSPYHWHLDFIGGHEIASIALVLWSRSRKKKSLAHWKTDGIWVQRPKKSSNESLQFLMQSKWNGYSRAYYEFGLFLMIKPSFTKGNNRSYQWLNSEECTDICNTKNFSDTSTLLVAVAVVEKMKFLLNCDQKRAIKEWQQNLTTNSCFCIRMKWQNLYNTNIPFLVCQRKTKIIPFQITFSEFFDD